MENNTHDYVYDPNVIQIEDADASRRFIANVFMWMFVALGISAGLAWWFGHNDVLFSYLIDVQTNSRTGLGTIVMFSPLAFILVMSFGVNRLSYPVLMILFVAYASFMGISLSFIFRAYPPELITGVFITTSVVFGVMAIAGYTTHQDLTKFGAILTMLLVGIIVASIVNFFMKSSGLSQIISYVGVAVFVGLTAYDVQKLKRIGAGLEYGEASTKKMAIMGALTLYLDFINLFLMLLRVFGGRRN
ncbi:Bax inhibitor-1/YccA family protein [Mucilaginibacter limnophilus]|uniref:Bax inhibitor-1/YccA family protein n=1 Tax=Mucilaginibacter limnophilus TaxID=1932778 RepID=A0A3S2V139_9SPHI|nr:Bax inhibitor-1/YccA family protein [Mucilaginibacter limnophilus]RVU00399.1 Bax inhibitor-1/YccA family protein [Mucilaginibacter limnophilus]